MAIKTDPESIQQEYQKGVQYNQQIGLYEDVEMHENFYINKCWEGVNAPDLDKPVLPMTKRAVNQFVAMIVSDDIASKIAARQANQEHAVDVLQREVENTFEDERVKPKNRLWLRNAAVDGDCCAYWWFDPDAETGQQALGRARVEVVDNTSTIFGNPQEQDVQKQPYILMPMRELVEDVKDEAEKNGVPEAERDGIHEDTDPNEYNSKFSPGGLATSIIKLWRNKGTGTIWATKTCGSVAVRKPWDTQYRLYPIAWMPWELVKNSYHGKSAMAGLIPNNIFINKLYAMMMMYVKLMAFPKVAYDKTRLPNGFSSKIGEQIGVNGNPSEIFSKPLVQADMSNQAIMLVDKIIEHTNNMIGASDVMLGNVRPENTSAIIALTKASTVPLEIQKLNFYQFIEDNIRILIEIVATDYGMRTVWVDDGEGNVVEEQFDFSQLKNIDFRLNIDVGASAYWSEIMQIQTADNMWMQKIIQDPIDYLEAIPDHMVKNKHKLIAKIKQFQALASQMPPDPEVNSGVPPDMQGGAQPPPM